jgi:hypothetical protein
MPSPFSRRAATRALTLLVCCGSAVALRAQSAAVPPAASVPTQLDPFLVPGRATDLIGTAASASQGIVGAADLAARPFLRRGELLEVIPGVVITQHSGGGKANQYFLRGFNLDHGTDFAVSVDGMPVNLRSHAHGQGYADLNFLIPELVRQVDYNKGPFFAEVGNFSAAGAAEFRMFDRLPAGFVQVTLGGHRFARLVAGATHAGPGTDATTAALELARDDGPWEVPEDFERVNGLFRHRWTRGAADYRLTAMAYHATWRATDQVPRRAVAAGTLGRFGTLDDSNGGSTERASLSLDAAWRGASATTRLNAYAIHYRLNLYSNFTYALDDPVGGDQFNQRDRRVVLGGALTRSWASTRGATRSETTAGLAWRGDFMDELGLHRTARRERVSTVRDDAVGELSAGGFVHHETRWSDRVRTGAGLRLDGHRFDVTGDDPRNSGRAADSITSPKLGAVFGPWAQTEVYANVGFGYHSNDARGTTIRVDPADGLTPVERVTPLVQSRGAEVGVRTAAVRGLVSSLTLWTLGLDSELVFVGDAGGTEPTGRTRRHGIEWTNFWRPRSWLSLDTDVALTHARYRDDAGGGTRIANSIGRVVTGGVSLGGETGGFGGVRLRYFGTQPLREDNMVRAPASTTINVRLGWRTPVWEFSADLLNAFDRRNNDIAYAYASRLPGEPADGVDDVHFHPAEPRMLRVTVARRF